MHQAQIAGKLTALISRTWETVHQAQCSTADGATPRRSLAWSFPTYGFPRFLALASGSSQVRSHLD